MGRGKMEGRGEMVRSGDGERGDGSGHGVWYRMGLCRRGEIDSGQMESGERGIDLFY